MRSKRFGVKVKSSYGNFYVETTQRGLYRLRFPGNPLTPLPSLPLHHAGGGRGWGKRIDNLLKKYFKGDPVNFGRLKIDLTEHTSFERAVLRALSHVKSGTTITYAELAKRAGFPGAARAVGSVMRKNRLPIILPCHRVIRSNGDLGDHSQGLAWKRKLLALEKAIAA